MDKGFDDATAAAAFLGANRETYVQHENGTRSFARAAERYAAKLGVTPEWLLWGRRDGDAPPMAEVKREIMVMGEVAAGLWREAAFLSAAEATESILLEVDGYQRAALYALKVVGRSMDDHYPPGRYVIVAPAAEAGVRWGDHVIVERRKADLVELTVKELVNDHGRTALWPRSSDPSFLPIYIEGDEPDQNAPRIIGIVVADYSRRQRPAEVFQPLQHLVDWAE